MIQKPEDYVSLRSQRAYHEPPLTLTAQIQQAMRRKFSEYLSEFAIEYTSRRKLTRMRSPSVNWPIGSA